MKRTISVFITLCMLATSVFAAPVSVGVENSSEINFAVQEYNANTSLFGQVTDAAFTGNPDFDTSHLGELFLYDDFATAAGSWNLGKDRSGNDFLRGEVFTKTSGLNAHLQIKKDVWAEGGYYTVTDTVSTYSFTNLYGGFTLLGATLPKGTYTTVIDMKFHEADATKIGFGKPGANNADMVDVGTYTPNEWNTYSRTFYSDGTLNGCIGSVVAWSSLSQGQERTFDYDNFALYYLPDRTITFNDGTSANDVVVKGQYLTSEQVSAVTAPTKTGFTFKGWSETQNGTIISDLAAYYTATSKELYAVWEENAQDGLFRNDVDTSKLGELFLYDDFGGADIGSAWSLGNNRNGNNYYRGSSFTKAGLNARFSYSADTTWNSDGYYTTSGVVDQYNYLGRESRFVINGNIPIGYYTIVIDINFDTNDATKMGFSNVGTAWSNDFQKVTAFTAGEANVWNTYVNSFSVATALTGNTGISANVMYPTSGSTKTFSYDNLAIYYLPNRTITFEVDSQMGTVNQNTLEIVGQYADISSVKVTPLNESIVFLGWMLKGENGSIIKSDTTQFYTAKDVTLAAVFADNAKAPVTNEGIEMRTRSPMGMRSIATVSYEQRNNAVEYGYIVALTKALNGEELTFESKCNKTYGVAYNKNGIDKVFYEDFENERIAFSGVFTGIPKTREAYSTPLTFRPYIKYSDGTYYGKAISKSLYETAYAIKNSDGFLEMPVEYQGTINEIVVLGTPPFITNGDAEDSDNVAFTSTNANVTIIDDTRYGGNKIFNVESKYIGNSSTNIYQLVEFEDGKRYNVSFDICYTGYADPTVTDTGKGRIAANFGYNDTTEATNSYNHIVAAIDLTPGEWTRVNCSKVIVNLKDNDNSRFIIYAVPLDNSYARNFMVDNIVVEASDEYNFELMGKTYDESGAEKDPTSFAVGEKATFKIGVYEGSNKSTNCKYLKYTVSYDDGQPSESAVVDASSGEITITTKALTKPGAIRVVASVCNAGGAPLKENSASSPSDLSFHFNGGIIAGFEDIRLATVDTAAEKADVEVADTDGVLVMEEKFPDRSFDEFWAEKLATIQNVDFSAAEISEVSNIGNYTIYSVYVPFGLPDDEQNTAGNKAAFYMSVPNNAEAGTLGVKAFYQGYGVADPSKPSTVGFITVSVCAHSILLGQDASYYANLNTASGGLAAYGLNRNNTETTPDESYFVGMLLRDIVAVNFAKQYAPNGDVLFDGERLEFEGGSQGAFQSIAVAGLMNDEATKLTAKVPWMCDLNGINTGRQTAEFRPDWAENGGHAYFDTGMFAKRVKCDTTVVAGIGDYTCPPAGIIAMYHNLGSANKSITLYQNMVHSQTILPLSNGMSYTHSN